MKDRPVKRPVPPRMRTEPDQRRARVAAAMKAASNNLRSKYLAPPTEGPHQ